MRIGARRRGDGRIPAGRGPTTRGRTAGRLLALAGGLLAALLTGITGMTALSGSAVAQGWTYPLILDVDLTPGPSCSGAVRGRVQVYHPEGAKTGAEIEWRVRAGNDQLADGKAVMKGPVAAAEFSIPREKVPSDGAVTVDARVLRSAALGGPGDFGKPWRDRIGHGCNPVRVAAVGDSVVWGQGLEHDQKFPYLTGELLGRATGRGHQHVDYSISGAVLDAPGLPDGNEDSGCLTRREKQDPDGDGEMEFGEVTQQMPDVFCQLETAGAQARSGGYGLDVVVLNGCINDLDPFLGIAVGVTPGSENLPQAVHRECAGIGAAPDNPAKDVPWFSGAKVGYGGRGIRAAIEKAHSLPGRPKVIVADFYYALSRATSPLLAKRCSVPGLDGPRLARCKGGLGEAAERYEQYTQLANEAYREAAETANEASSDGAYAVAADGLFTLDNATLGRDSKVWGSPFADPQYPLRKLACPALSATPVQCLTAAVAHPDIDGARQYADSFLLNPRVRDWFGLPSTGPEVSLTVRGGDRPAGSEVDFTATLPDGSPPEAGYRYHWYFGDGTKHETDKPVSTHVYHREGPYLPRLVVTGAAGQRVLTEASIPVVVKEPSG
ncbi:PKD domain-containing protein [Streptomyces sp. NPDC004647]|uniref:PKD domain-containing protein n=1 Tax=Streptomyces sp. NPDC004647 TaxID=3154671 RepID=UPI0033AB6548